MVYSPTCQVLNFLTQSSSLLSSYFEKYYTLMGFQLLPRSKLLRPSPFPNSFLQHPFRTPQVHNTGNLSGYVHKGYWIASYAMLNLSIRIRFFYPRKKRVEGMEQTHSSLSCNGCHQKHGIQQYLHIFFRSQSVGEMEFARLIDHTKTSKRTFIGAKMMRFSIASSQSMIFGKKLRIRRHTHPPACLILLISWRHDLLRP